MDISKRFQNENLADHWQVDDSKSSFECLLFHLEHRTNFKVYFLEALQKLNMEQSTPPIVIADIGAGIGWTSALMARHPKVHKVYGVDASDKRLQHAKFVSNHFNIQSKIEIIKGTFEHFNVNQAVDFVVLCGSLHHCYNKQMKTLFLNIKKILKPHGKVLIANEHYVNYVWTLKRFLSYLKGLLKRKEVFNGTLTSLRAPDPFDGEHWRTRKELEHIFHQNGFRYQFFIHKGDLCLDKYSWYHRLGWFYYYAVLESK